MAEVVKRNNMKTLKIFSLVLISSSLLQFCNKSETQAEGISSDETKGPLSSVFIVNGKYKIDSMTIWRYHTRSRLIKDVNAIKLVDKKTVQEIPEFISAFLNEISPKGKFEMANPGEDFYIEDITSFSNPSFNTVANKKLPTKQLVYFGIDNNTAILSYYCGGLGKWQCTTIIKFKDEKITDFWYGNTSFALSKEKIVYDLKDKRGGGC